MLAPASSQVGNRFVWSLWDVVDGAAPPQVCWSLPWWASESLVS